jgi:hypothetical protein
MGGLLAKMMAQDSRSDLWELRSPQPFEKLVGQPDDRDLLRTVLFFRSQPEVRRLIFIATPHRGSRLDRGIIRRVGGYHSIIADLRDPPLAGGTYGVMPYTSAHLAGASSELLVHGGHLCQAHPLVIREVGRILMEHLRLPVVTRLGGRPQDDSLRYRASSEAAQPCAAGFPTIPCGNGTEGECELEVGKPRPPSQPTSRLVTFMSTRSSRSPTRRHTALYDNERFRN